MVMDIWVDLLNSDWHDYRGSGRREDRLDDPAWLRRYIARWDKALTGVSADTIREGLRDLRTVLRGIVDRLASGRPVPARLWGPLNALLAASPIIRRLGRTSKGYSVDFVPVEGGLKEVVAEIAASFCGTLAEGEPGRIKVCDNRDCLWVFYDRSKNRSRRWCESATGCGNMMKVRRFRRQHGKPSSRRLRSR